MKTRKKDFLSRRPVRAEILIALDGNERSIAGKLPENYLFDNGVVQFPAGFWESYFVNGKEYNVDGDRTLEEQRELIIQDLAQEGFNKEEAKEFINAIETEEKSLLRLDFTNSNRWLHYHPEFEHEAMKKLKEAAVEVKKESEMRGRGKRR